MWLSMIFLPVSYTHLDVYKRQLLLHAMETASADSMPEGVERQGIGTPATRAAIIEKLVQKGFLERKGSKKTCLLYTSRCV